MIRGAPRCSEVLRDVRRSSPLTAHDRHRSRPGGFSVGEGWDASDQRQPHRGGVPGPSPTEAALAVRHIRDLLLLSALDLVEIEDRDVGRLPTSSTPRSRSPKCSALLAGLDVDRFLDREDAAFSNVLRQQHEVVPGAAKELPMGAGAVMLPTLLGSRDSLRTMSSSLSQGGIVTVDSMPFARNHSASASEGWTPSWSAYSPSVIPSGPARSGSCRAESGGGCGNPRSAGPHDPRSAARVYAIRDRGEPRIWRLRPGARTTSCQV